MTVISPPPPPEAVSPKEMAEVIGKAIVGTLFRNVLFALILGCVAMFGKSMIYNAYTPDLPWLLASGQHILTHHALPTHDIFSWTHPDKPWTLYQWLFEAMIAWGQGRLGDQMLLKTFVLVVFGVYVGIPYVRHAREGIPTLFALLIPAIALYCAAINMSLRPMIATTLFLLVQYVLIHRYRRGNMSLKTLLPALGILYAVWGNMHTGVTIGLLSLMLFALGDLLERKRWYPFMPVLPALEGRPKTLFVYAGLLATGFAASLLNPYGPEIYTYLADLSSQSYLNSVIVELQSPNFHVMNYWFFLALFTLFLLLLMQAFRVMSASAFIHLLVFTLATLFAQRFVVWACLFYALELPRALFFWWTERRQSAASFFQGVAAFECYRPLLRVSLGLALLVFMLGGPWVPNKALEMTYGGCEPMLPVIEAYQKLKQPSDHTFMEPEAGSCMLVRYPREKVFFDTRFDFYGQRFTQSVRNTSVLLGDWQGVLNRWDINTLVIGKRWALTQLLKSRPEYQVLYEDKTMLILRKKAARPKV